MLESIVIGILTGLVTGVLSGYYSGLVVSRTSRFNALIRDAERALKNIEYMQEGHRAKIWGFERHAMNRAADDLAADKQVKASVTVRSQLYAMIREIGRAERGETDIDEFEKLIETSRSTVSSLRAHPRVFKPWGAP